MSRNSLLDFYREIVNSEKSFGIDYKNLSKQLIERIDKAIDFIDNWKKYKKDKGSLEVSMLDLLYIKEILGGKEDGI